MRSTPKRYQWSLSQVQDGKIVTIEFDFYRLCGALGLTSEPQKHALKKVIRAGRSVKDLATEHADIKDALDTWLRQDREDRELQALQNEATIDV